MTDALEPATEKSMQEVANDVEAALYPQSEPEPEGEKVVVEDEAILPETDDTDSADDEGLEDELENIAEEEELSLADYLGIDDEKLSQDESGNWQFNAIIDGEEKQVLLKDLTKSYQIQGHVNNKSIALENERKEFKVEQTRLTGEMTERITGLDNMLGFLEQEVVSEYQGIDWDRLRTENPSEWTALRQEFAEKAQRLQEAKSLVGEESKRLTDENNLKQQNLFSEHLKSQNEKMLIANPTWTDEAVLMKDMGVLKTFVKDAYGFTDEDTQLVTDHRLIGLIQDAQKYRAGKSVAKTKREKVVPKFQKSRATQANKNQLAKARTVKARKAAIKKSGGSIDSIAQALIDRM